MQRSFKRGSETITGSLSLLGIPAEDSQPALQSEAYTELVNKIAWAIGSTYGAPYHNVRTAARLEAIKAATAVVVSHGYPKKIAYPQI